MTKQLTAISVNRWQRRFSWIIAIAAFTTVMVWCIGTARAQTENPTPTRKWDSSVYAELAKAPKKAVDRPNPMQGDTDAVAAGAKLYDLHCAECHGDLAAGEKGPSLRAEEVQQATPGAIFWLLTNGVVRRGMPVWSKLPEPQRWQLVSYIKSLTPAQKSSGNPSSLPSTSSSGAK